MLYSIINRETVYRQICSSCANTPSAPSQVNAAVVISANCMQILVHLNKRFIFWLQLCLTGEKVVNGDVISDSGKDDCG